MTYFARRVRRLGRLGMILCLACAAAPVQAQLQRLSVEVIGGTVDLPVNSSMSPPKVGGLIYGSLTRDSAGKACLSVAPFAQPQTTNKTIFDHILLMDNRCGKEIRIKACYYKTESCKTLSVGGYKRQQQILGIFPGPDFRFSYREYVN